jgi:hypothetical protein
MQRNKGVAIGSVTATATCPGSAQVNQNVNLVGNHSYSIPNDTDLDFTVYITCQITDGEGHIFTSRDPIIVASHTTQSGSSTTQLAVAYESPGSRTATASTSAGDPINLSIDGNCSFQVTA